MQSAIYRRDVHCPICFRAWSINLGESWGGPTIEPNYVCGRLSELLEPIHAICRCGEIVRATFLTRDPDPQL